MLSIRCVTNTGGCTSWVLARNSSALYTSAAVLCASAATRRTAAARMTASSIAMPPMAVSVPSMGTRLMSSPSSQSMTPRQWPSRVRSLHTHTSSSSSTYRSLGSDSSSLAPLSSSSSPSLASSSSRVPYGTIQVVTLTRPSPRDTTMATHSRPVHARTLSSPSHHNKQTDGAQQAPAAVNDDSKEAIVNTSDTSATTTTDDTPLAAVTEKTEKQPWTMQRVKVAIVKEAKHMWHGTKLLWLNVRECSKLLKKMMSGNELSRREGRQMRRTLADLGRLVPFVVIVLIPFMEFALPLLLKLFPNMLPSTFADKDTEKAQRKAALKVKMEMASYLKGATGLMVAQESEAAKLARGDRANVLTLEEFQSFRAKVENGVPVSHQEVLKYCKMFEDSLTLDGLDRPQLMAMCKLLDLKTWEPTGMLRNRLEGEIRRIKRDDRQIRKEGVESLTLSELREACRKRGMNPERSHEQLMRKMSEWLELSLDHDIPTALLIFTRTFSSAMTLQEKAAAKDTPLDDSLASGLRNLPQNLMEDARAEVAQVTTSGHARIQLLEEEAKKIATEAKSKEPKKAKPTKTDDTVASTTADEKEDAKKADDEWEQKATADEQQKPGYEKAQWKELIEELEEAKAEAEKDLEELKEDVEELKEDIEEAKAEAKDKKKVMPSIAKKTPTPVVTPAERTGAVVDELPEVETPEQALHDAEEAATAATRVNQTFSELEARIQAELKELTKKDRAENEGEGEEGQRNEDDDAPAVAPPSTAAAAAATVKDLKAKIKAATEAAAAIHTHKK